MTGAPREGDPPAPGGPEAVEAARLAAAAGATGEVPAVTVDPPAPQGRGPDGGRRLLKDNIVVATGTALSRVTGVLRTLAVLAFSARLADVYLLANNTPNIIYELILGGILTATLVPLFTEHIERDDRDATDAVVSVILVALVGLTLVALVVAPLLMLFYASGVDEVAGADQAVERAQFLRVGIYLSLLFVPQVFFYGAMALGSALLNARRRFFAAAWAPVLNNAVVIAVLVGASLTTAGELELGQVDDDPRLLWLIGLGTTAGIAGMALSLVPALWRAGVRLRFRPSLRHPAVRTAVALSGWTLGYVIANQVAAQTVNRLAVVEPGAVRSYQIGFMFFQLPHGLLAVSLMTTFQPDLARAFVQRSWATYHARLLQGLRLLVAVVVPAAIGYLALATLVVRLGPGTEAFGPGGTFSDAVPIAEALAGFAPGLIGFSVYLFVLRAFYAVQDTRRPFWVNAGENALNIALAVALSVPFGLLGLTSAYSAAYLVFAAVALAVLLRRVPAGFDVRGFVVTLARCLAAAAVMAVVVVATVLGVTAVAPEQLLAGLLLAVATGGAAYVVAALRLGVARDAGLGGRLPGPLRRLSR